MTAKKKKPGPKVSVSWGSAYIYSTEPIRCPLCSADVPPKTEHECRKEA